MTPEEAELFKQFGVAPEEEEAPSAVKAAIEKEPEKDKLTAVLEKAAKITGTSIIETEDDAHGRGDISATTLGRILGLATASEMKLIEQKLDMLNARVSTMTTKMDRIVGIMSNAPTGADLERIDIKVGSIQDLIRKEFAALGGGFGATNKPAKPGATGTTPAVTEVDEQESPES